MKMTASAAGIALAKRFEVLRLQRYDDGFGNATIGWGHVIGKDESFTEIDAAEAESLFQADRAAAEGVVNRGVTVAVNQNQFDAIWDFAFNIGPGRQGYKDGLLWLRNGHQSSLLRLLNAGNYVGAAQQILLWDRANGKESSGLLRRRAAEKALFLTPVA